MKFSISVTDLTSAEANQILALIGSGGVSTAGAIPVAATPPSAPPSTPPGTPTLPPAAAPSAPPMTTPPPAAASPAPQDGFAAVQAAMEKYVAKYGAQAALNVMSQVQVTRIRDVTDPAVLKWLTDSFNAG